MGDESRVETTILFNVHILLYFDSVAFAAKLHENVTVHRVDLEIFIVVFVFLVGVFILYDSIID